MRITGLLSRALGSTPETHPRLEAAGREAPDVSAPSRIVTATAGGVLQRPVVGSRAFMCACVCSTPCVSSPAPVGRHLGGGVFLARAVARAHEHRTETTSVGTWRGATSLQERGAHGGGVQRRDHSMQHLAELGPTGRQGARRLAETPSRPPKSARAVGPSEAPPTAAAPTQRYQESVTRGWHQPPPRPPIARHAAQPVGSFAPQPPRR